ncbi:MAG: response regulator transcription factor [Chloroflexi bacterium]|nr:response regulator transcription factor [Chloroflexota bacterium]
MTTKVLLVDDVDEVRRDLCTLLCLSNEIEVIGEAANGLDAIRQVESLQPDAILMDLEMPVMDGYEATWRIKSQFPCKVIALTVHDYESARAKAFQSGVDAFLVKGAPVEKIIQSIVHRTTA